MSQLASVLTPGARVVLQSDDLGIAEAMRACFEQHGHSHFRPALGPSSVQSSEVIASAAASVQPHSRQPVSPKSRGLAEGWHERCLPVPSDREVLCQQQGMPIYRTVLVRTETAQGSSGGSLGQDANERHANLAGCET